MSEIRLEPWAEGDLPLLERLMGDPAMTEHLGGPEPADKIAERHGRYLDANPGTVEMFKIVDGREAVGSVGYWERPEGDDKVYETGWLVLPSSRAAGSRPRGRTSSSSTCGAASASTASSTRTPPRTTIRRTRSAASSATSWWGRRNTSTRRTAATSCAATTGGSTSSV